MPFSFITEHHHFGLAAADLKPEAAAFHLDRGGRGPACPLTARDEPTTVLAADAQGRALQRRHDDDAVRLLDQVLRDALFGLRNLRERLERFRAGVEALGRVSTGSGYDEQ
jgi:hypothetical protein